MTSIALMYDDRGGLLRHILSIRRYGVRAERRDGGTGGEICHLTDVRDLLTRDFNGIAQG